jgi:hypothetical protein
VAARRSREPDGEAVSNRRTDRRSQTPARRWKQERGLRCRGAVEARASDQRRGKAGDRRCSEVAVGRTEGGDRNFRGEGSEVQAEAISCRASGDCGGAQEAMGGKEGGRGEGCGESRSSQGGLTPAAVFGTGRAPASCSPRGTRSVLPTGPLTRDRRSPRSSPPRRPSQ